MSRRALMSVAIALLVVIDVGLIVLAMRRTDAPPAVASPVGSASVAAAATPSGPATESPVAKATASGAAPSDVDSGQGWLVDISKGAVLRARAGTCTAGGFELAFRPRGSDTFADWTAPADFAVRITLVDTDEAWFVGGEQGAECDLDFFRTRNGGRDWERSESTDNAWHLLADPAAAQLHAPAGPVDSPCGTTAAIDLAAVTTEVAFILCDDSSLHATQQSGESWTMVSTVERATAVAFAGVDDGYLATANTTECPGVEVSRTSDGGVSWAVVGCIDGLGEGPVRLAASDEWLVAVSGGRMALSSDRGTTWQVAG